MSDVTCRGSFALGTACRKCSRCRREIESYNAMKAVRDKLNTPSSAISRIEELEAKLRESALQELSALGQASEAYQAQLAAEARTVDLEAKLAEAVDLLRRYLHVDDVGGEERATLAELKGEAG